MDKLYQKIIVNDEIRVKFLKECEAYFSFLWTKLYAAGEVYDGQKRDSLKNSRKRDLTSQVLKTKYFRCRIRGWIKWKSISS